MTVFNVLIYISIVAVFATSFITIYKAITQVFTNRQAIVNRVNNIYKENNTLSYKTLKLSRTGVMFRMKNYNLTPANYLTVKLFVGVLISVLAGLLLEDAIYCIPGFVLGYFGVPLYFWYENKRDNAEILMDIYNTYSNLKTQLAANVYIRECLESTYEIVNNLRYKAALHELITNMADKTVLNTDAILIFRNRFDSSEINKLAALLNSFSQFGVNASHTDDIMSEIQGILQAQALETEQNIERKAGFTNFLFFGAIIIMLVFIMMNQFPDLSSF